MRNLKKHIIMVSAAAMFAAAGFAGNSVFAAEPTTDNFVLPPQMTEQQKADWAKDNPQYREKETQQAERTARMAPKAVTPDEVTNTGRDYCIALLNAEEGRAPRSDENAMMQKDGQPAPSDKANGPRVRRGDRRMPEGQQQPQHRFHRKDGQKDEYKLIPSLKDTKSFTKKPLFPERLFEWEFWWVEGNRATAGKNKGSSRFFVG